MPTLDIEAKKRLLTEASMTTEMRTRAWKKMKALPGFVLPTDTFRSGYQVSAHLGRCAGVEVDEIDCCINDCRLFHGAFAEDDECLCTAPRYKADVSGSSRPDSRRQSSDHAGTPGRHTTKNMAIRTVFESPQSFVGRQGDGKRDASPGRSS